MFQTLLNNGFTVKKGLFKHLYVVSFNDTEIIYVRDNDNGTFKTIEFLKYPSSFNQFMHSVSIEKVVEILKSVVKNNF